MRAFNIVIISYENVRAILCLTKPRLSSESRGFDGKDSKRSATSPFPPEIFRTTHVFLERRPLFSPITQNQFGQSYDGKIFDIKEAQDAQGFAVVRFKYIVAQ
jgi:hypothetical protein